MKSICLKRFGLDIACRVFLSLMVRLKIDFFALTETISWAKPLNKGTIAQRFRLACNHARSCTDLAETICLQPK